MITSLRPNFGFSDETEAATRARLEFEQTRDVIERTVLSCQHCTIFGRWGQQYTEVLPVEQWPLGVRRGPLGQCYQTSASYACLNERFTYTEGWAIRNGFPAQHAWLFDAKLQRIIDPTWVEPAGQWYFGVGVSRAVVGRFRRARVWPILDAISDRDEGLSEIFLSVPAETQNSGLKSAKVTGGLAPEPQHKSPSFL